MTEYSKGDYKRLSERIRKAPDAVSDDDLAMLQALRVTYKEPLALVFSTIEKMALKIDRGSICTYRVKRIESIIGKLTRFPDMQVQRMEDIAGCRCIMSSTELVYELFRKIERNAARLPFEIKGKVNDYIATPKASGYRSLHLNVTLRDGDSRRIEIQLRSYDHHNWATLVETTDLIYKAKLKEYADKVSPELFEFHKLLSIEDKELSRDQKERIINISQQFGYMEKIGTVFSINYLNVRDRWNQQRLQRCSFFLIAAGADGLPEFNGYSNFLEAEEAYFNLYTNNHEQRNIVLTHLQRPTFQAISTAYSNYFLTYNAVLLRTLRMLSGLIINFFDYNRLRHFRRYYSYFFDIIVYWYSNKLAEIDSFHRDEVLRYSHAKKAEWTASLKGGGKEVNDIISELQDNLKLRAFHLILWTVKRSIDRRYIERMLEIDERAKQARM